MKRWQIVLISFLLFPTLLYFSQSLVYYEFYPEGLGLFMTDFRFFFFSALAVGLVLLLIPLSFAPILALTTFSLTYSVLLFHAVIIRFEDLNKVFLGQRELDRQIEQQIKLSELKNKHYTTDRYGDYAFFLTYKKNEILNNWQEKRSLEKYNKKFNALCFLSTKNVSTLNALRKSKIKLQQCKKAILSISRKTCNACENSYFLLKKQQPQNALVFHKTAEAVREKVNNDLDYNYEFYNTKYNEVDYAERIVDYLVLFFGLYKSENDTTSFSEASLNENFSSLVNQFHANQDKIQELLTSASSESSES